MKKLLALILLLASIVALVSCSGGSDVPEGMQLVAGGEELGYYFYAPEEWTTSNYGKISAAYASNVDNSSISYTELDAPEGTIAEYFAESLKEFPKAPTVTVNGEEVTFGNADRAVKFVFEHEYNEHKFRTMQIFVCFEERFGLFTYNSMLENISSSETFQYDFYKEKIDKVIENFKFVAKEKGSSEDKYPVGDDGYKLISDISVAKFSLYVTDDFSVDESSGIVSATLEDGSNITMSAATATGVVVSEYWERRKDELSAVTSDITEIEVNKEATLGNAKRAFSYEYTYVYNGTKYHVYQILAVTTFDGFTFTYTATEENYAKHLEIIQDIAERVEF